MTRDEHRALAEWQIAEADKMFLEYRTPGNVDPDGMMHSLISHLRQSAAVHATLAGLPEVTT